MYRLLLLISSSLCVHAYMYAQAFVQALDVFFLRMVKSKGKVAVLNALILCKCCTVLLGLRGGGGGGVSLYTCIVHH